MVDECMYSNVKNRRLNDIFGNECNSMSHTPYRLRESRFKRKQRRYDLENYVIKYKPPPIPIITVKYPIVNNINKFGMNKDRDMVINSIDEVDMVEVKKEGPENNDSPVIESDFGQALDTQVMHKDYSFNDSISTDNRGIKIESICKPVTPTKQPNDEDQEVNADVVSWMGQDSKYSMSNLEKSVNENLNFTININFSKSRNKDKVSEPMIEQASSKCFFSNAECIKENEFKENGVTSSGNKNDDSGINFDVSKCKHSTPHKERENIVVVSKDSIDKLCEQILMIEEKVKRMEVESSVASDVKRAVHLVQSLQRDLKRNCNLNKKFEVSDESNFKPKEMKTREVETDQRSRKKLPIQLMKDETTAANFDLEDVSREIPISMLAHMVSSSKEAKVSNSSDSERFQR